MTIVVNYEQMALDMRRLRHRAALSELDALTTVLRDRMDAWVRQLRRIEQHPRFGLLEHRKLPPATRSRVGSGSGGDHCPARHRTTQGQPHLPVAPPGAR